MAKPIFGTTSDMLPTPTTKAKGCQFDSAQGRDNGSRVGVTMLIPSQSREIDSFRGGKNQFAQSITGRSRSFFVSVLTASFFLTAASAKSVNPGENIADAAEKLIGDIRETHYQHETHVVQSAGVYDMDCSGFVDFLLKRVAPDQYDRLPIEPGHARPRAVVYFELLDGLTRQDVPGWQPIRQLADAKRGDLIAWALEASTQKPGDTGHVVIVAAPPVLAAPGEYRVEVYDSSGIRHDDDSRPKGTSGIGKGVIIFRVDQQGMPVGFQFNSHAHFHQESIAIGRIVN
jgi:hypothetical protein